MRGFFVACALACLGCYEEIAEQGGPGSDESSAEGGTSLAQVSELLGGDGAETRTDWILQLGSSEARLPYENETGWMELFGQNAVGALAAFGPLVARIDTIDDLEREGRIRRGLARAHLTMAAVLRQGALAAAHGYVHTFGGDNHSETDPDETAYLVGIGLGIRGECESSAAVLTEAFEVMGEDAVENALVATSIHAIAREWLSWAESPACPVTSGPEGPYAGAWGDPEPGRRPNVGDQSRFRFAESVGDRQMALSDPTELLQLAQWHVAAAGLAAPEAEAEIVGALDSLWRLPGRAVRGRVGDMEVDLAWMLFGLAMVPADIDFVNEASISGLEIVSDWTGRSVLASLLAASMVDSGLDSIEVTALGSQLEQWYREQLEIEEGEVHRSHGRFAALAPAALARAGMVVSEAEDQKTTAGILGQALYDMSWDGPIHLRFSEAQTGWVAWKTETRNTYASEFLHRLTATYPELEIARLALDRMNLRVQANSISHGATQ